MKHFPIYHRALVLLALLLLAARGVTAVGTPSLGQSSSETAETFSLHEFAGDLLVPEGADGPYGGTPAFRYATALPEIAQLATLKPGLSRAVLLKDFKENGGLTSNEYFIQKVSIKERLVCVRLFFRPAAMPETTFNDSKLRQSWLIEHKPEPDPADVLMRFTRPFLNSYILD